MSIFHTTPRPISPNSFDINVESLAIATRKEPTQKILRGIRLVVAQGDFLGIHGESGSGKSTLGKAVVGLVSDRLQIEAGTVRYGSFDIFDRSLSNDDRAKIRGKHIGYVPQSPNMVPEWSALENVLNPLKSKLGRREAKQQEPFVDYLFEQYGMSDKATRDARVLSGGEQQRVSIIRALAGDPDVVVMDEPTAALNGDWKDAVNERLTDMHVSGKTIAVITHEQTTATSHIVMDNGLIVPSMPATHAA